MYWKRVLVGDRERALLIKNGRFSAILEPGEYRVFVAPWVSLEIERHSVRDLVFRSRWTDYLIDKRPDLVQRYFTLVETNDVQVGMVYVDGELFHVLVPAKRVLFWRGQAEVTAEIVDVIGEPLISFPSLSALERTTEHAFATIMVVDDELEM
jgi:hypothetical protein